MEASLNRMGIGLANTKTWDRVKEAKLREPQPGEQMYKVNDGGNDFYVVVSPSGSRSARYDYRLSGRRVWRHAMRQPVTSDWNRPGG